MAPSAVSSVTSPVASGIQPVPGKHIWGECGWLCPERCDWYQRTSTLPSRLADRVLSRTYVHRSASLLGRVLVLWYQSQRSGHSQPHSPQMCLPGTGWIPEATGEVTLDTADGAITVNRYVVAKGKERAAVLFWYQRPRRVVAGECGWL